MTMHGHLIAVAEGITGRAPGPLPPPQQFESWRRHRQARYLEAMGLDRYLAEPRPPVEIRLTQSHQRDGYRVECIAFESLPGLWVAANLYVPDAPGPHPAMLYACGHSSQQKLQDRYQAHGRRFAQLGFVTLVYDTIQYGEVRGYHHGTYRHGQFQWLSRGYYPIAVEVWNGIRALDLLTARADVDPARLGVTGISGGGSLSWWLTVADDRIAAASICCSTGTVASHVRERTIDGHCDCTFPANPYGWDLTDFALLAAPRPVQIVSASRDNLFAIDSIEDLHGRLAGVYRHLGVAERLELVTYRAHHSYQEIGRKATWRWFLRHLQGRDVAPEALADQDSYQEPASVLSVFLQGKGRPAPALPPNDRSATVQDWFVPLAAPPLLTSREELERHRAQVVESLRRLTLGTFPDPLPDPGARITRRSMDGSGLDYTYLRYTSEPGVELAGSLYTGTAQQADTVVVELTSPHERRGLSSDWLVPELPDRWCRAALSPRGTGSTAWAPQQQWHLRRAAALTGRTLASLRVLDILQGLAALRRLPDGEEREVWLAAEGEMVAPALYAALLDGKVAGIIMADPPATQDEPGPADGTGPVLEMLNCLRFTDLPQVAGMLWPTALIFKGPRPASYLWAEDLYTRLGGPGGFWHTSDGQNLSALLQSAAAHRRS